MHCLHKFTKYLKNKSLPFSTKHLVFYENLKPSTFSPTTSLNNIKFQSWNMSFPFGLVRIPPQSRPVKNEKGSPVRQNLQPFPRNRDTILHKRTSTSLDKIVQFDSWNFLASSQTPLKSENGLWFKSNRKDPLVNWKRLYGDKNQKVCWRNKESSWW